MKNLKIIFAGLLLCCVIAACGGDKKSTDEVKQADEQQITQEQLEQEKQKAVEEALQAEKAKAEEEKRQQELEAEQNKQKAKTTTSKKQAEAGKPATSGKVEDEQYTNPRKFMRAENVSFGSRGLLSSNFDLSYTIINKASSVSYKNVIFRIEYFDANGESLGAREHKYHDEVFAPNQTKAISTTVEKIKGTETIKVRCASATAVR